MVSQSFWAGQFLIYGFKPPQHQQLIPMGVTHVPGSQNVQFSIYVSSAVQFLQVINAVLKDRFCFNVN